MVVDLAGIVAQRRHRLLSVRRRQGSSDFHSPVDLVNRFTESDRETEAYLKILKIRAELMMDRTGAWECVEALATALLDRKVLSANEVAEIIKATYARILKDRSKSRGLSSP